jgi:hypothetical protein
MKEPSLRKRERVAIGYLEVQFGADNRLVTDRKKFSLEKLFAEVTDPYITA